MKNLVCALVYAACGATAFAALTTEHIEAVRDVRFVMKDGIIYRR